MPEQAFTRRSQVPKPPISIIADPSTIESQTRGAHLRVKRKPWIGLVRSDGLKLTLGDIIVLERGIGNRENASKIKATNFRTKERGNLIWRAVFPVGQRKRCNCIMENQKCNSIYEDFDASMVSRKRS